MRVWGIDPSFRNTAIVWGDYDREMGMLSNLDGYQVSSTSRQKRANEYKYEVDFERMSRILEKWRDFSDSIVISPEIIHVEAPTGSQSSRAAIGYAVSWMVISYLKLRFPLADFHLHKPDQVKEWATGNKTAQKWEMIEAAYGYFPNFPWKLDKRKGRISPSEEHKADALCTLKFGLETINV